MIATPLPPKSDRPFFVALGLLAGVYLALIAALLVADLAATSPAAVAHAFASPELRSAVWLSLLSSTAAAILSVWVGVPLGYLLARTRFPGKWLVELLVDVPVVLPPLVVGLSLLLLFQTAGGRWFEQHAVPVTYAVAGVVLAQFTVSGAFAARTMRVAFDGLDQRTEAIARTLGCTRAGAFWRVTLPEARRGVVAAFTLAWARALGEFGPILVFCGVTRGRTEVMSTAVFLELSVGNLEAAVAVSLLMIAVAVAVLVVLRAFGRRDGGCP
jgi:molybdate transport system permease protein